MTRITNSRLAGLAFLIYIATGITTMILSGRMLGPASDAASRLAHLAQHEGLARAIVLLTLPQFASAVILGVTLYALTRDEDGDLALLAMSCRLIEGAVGAMAAVHAWGKVNLVTALKNGGDPAVLGAILDSQLRLSAGTAVIPAWCFSVGSLLFCYLFLRARSIPVWLAWLGVFASALLVVLLPVTILGVLRGPVEFVIWLPMLVFEIVFAIWLMLKGVAPPARTTVAA